MFPEMRRNDRQLDETDAERILLEGEYGILSTADAEGCPYGVPVSYAYRDGIIYFHCAKDVGLKLANIAQNAKVCFTVVGSTEVLPAKFSTKYESAVAFGTAKAAADKRIGLQLLIEKYSSAYLTEGKAYIDRSLDTVSVYEITVEHLTAKGRR